MNTVHFIESIGNSVGLSNSAKFLVKFRKSDPQSLADLRAWALSKKIITHSPGAFVAFSLAELELINTEAAAISKIHHIDYFPTVAKSNAYKNISLALSVAVRKTLMRIITTPFDFTKYVAGVPFALQGRIPDGIGKRVDEYFIFTHEEYVHLSMLAVPRYSFVYLPRILDRKNLADIGFNAHIHSNMPDFSKYLLLVDSI